MVAMGAASDRGTGRPVNQDAAYAVSADTAVGELCLAVVCDGVGGLEQGEVASAAVAQGFVGWFHAALPQLINAQPATFALDAVEASWKHLLQGLNAEIYDHGARQCRPSGTTCTAVMVHGRGYLACQVGDSRLYRVSERGCAQLTADQTLVAALVARGELEPDEAAAYPDHNVIMQAVGATASLAPEFSYGAVAEGDLLVACTDGAYRCVDERCLQDVFVGELAYGAGALDAACRSLLGKCMDAGETDNLTVVCLAPYGQATRRTDTVVVG